MKEQRQPIRLHVSQCIFVFTELYIVIHCLAMVIHSEKYISKGSHCSDIMDYMDTSRGAAPYYLIKAIPHVEMA